MKKPAKPITLKVKTDFNGVISLDKEAWENPIIELGEPKIRKKKANFDPRLPVENTAEPAYREDAEIVELINKYQLFSRLKALAEQNKRHNLDYIVLELEEVEA